MKTHFCTKGFLPLFILVIMGVLVLAGGASTVIVRQFSEEAAEETVPSGILKEDEVLGVAVAPSETDGIKPIPVDTNPKSEAGSLPASGAKEKITVPSAPSVPSSVVPKTVTQEIPKIMEKETTDGGVVDASPLIQRFIFNQKWRDAVVNLVCQDGDGNILTTGSGVIIDPKGVILTNAHVASDFLFTEEWSPFTNPYTCVVRTGDPAVYRYKAQMLYIARERVKSEASSVSDQSDAGYEIHAPKDYALLLITEPISATSELPASFPYMPLYLGKIPQVGSYMYIIGYPARYVSYQLVAGPNFRMVASPLVVKERRLIKGTSALNILAFEGSIAGQHGASGGAVINDTGEIVAIPTFLDKDFGETSSEGILNAITVAYVNEDLKMDTGLTLQAFVSRDTPEALHYDFMEKHTPEYQCLYSNAARKYHNASPLAFCQGWE